MGISVLGLAVILAGPFRLALALHRSGDNPDPGWPEKGFGQMNYRAMVRAGREPISTPGMPDEGDAADGRNAQIAVLARRLGDRVKSTRSRIVHWLGRSIRWCNSSARDKADLVGYFMLVSRVEEVHRGRDAQDRCDSGFGYCWL